MKTKKPIKQFIVRKYILATSAREAIALDRKHEPDDVWVDDKWVAPQANVTTPGFTVNKKK